MAEKQTLLTKMRAAEQGNLETARRVLELWDTASDMQRKLAIKCIQNLGDMADKATLERLMEQQL